MYNVSLHAAANKRFICVTVVQLMVLLVLFTQTVSFLILKNTMFKNQFLTFFRDKTAGPEAKEIKQIPFLSYNIAKIFFCEMETKKLKINPRQEIGLLRI